MWWLADEGTVVHTNGHSCAPENPEYWWFPSRGYSSANVFPTEGAAKTRALEQCDEAMAIWQKRLNILQKGAK